MKGHIGKFQDGKSFTFGTHVYTNILAEKRSRATLASQLSTPGFSAKVFEG